MVSKTSEGGLARIGALVLSKTTWNVVDSPVVVGNDSQLLEEQDSPVASMAEARASPMDWTRGDEELCTIRTGFEGGGGACGASASTAFAVMRLGPLLSVDSNSIPANELCNSRSVHSSLDRIGEFFRLSLKAHHLQKLVRDWKVGGAY